MCLSSEKKCNVLSMTGYVVVVREEYTNEVFYRGTYRVDCVAQKDVRMEAVMFGDYVGGFHAFKDLTAAKAELKTWSKHGERVIVECLLEDVFSEGIFSVFPKTIYQDKNIKKKKVENLFIAVRARYRTILHELVV